jgi:hypothetical protein
MKTYFLKKLNTLKNRGRELDDFSVLTDKHWILYDHHTEGKVVYIFRGKNELIISNNGKAEICYWDLIDVKTLIIKSKNETLLFRKGFLNENVLALNLDGTEKYAVLVQEAFLNDFRINYLSVQNYFDQLDKQIIKIGNSEPLVSGYKSEIESGVKTVIQNIRHHNISLSDDEKELIGSDISNLGVNNLSPLGKKAYFLTQLKFSEERILIMKYFKQPSEIVNSIEANSKTNRIDYLLRVSKGMSKNKSIKLFLLKELEIYA